MTIKNNRIYFVLITICLCIIGCGKNSHDDMSHASGKSRTQTLKSKTVNKQSILNRKEE